QVAGIDNTCNRFRSDSELGMLNSTRGPIRISSELADVLRIALRAARLTGGALDPTIGGAVLRAGYGRDFAQVVLADPVDLPALSVVPGWQMLTLTDDNWLQRDAPLTIDLDVVAKALAVDRGAAAAIAAGARGVLFEIGGDIAVA